MIIGVYFSITAILLMSIDSSKITEIQRTPSLVNRVAKPMKVRVAKWNSWP